MIAKIDDDNFFNVALKCYENPQCRSIEEFKLDLDRVSYIKRHVKRYILTKKIKERLLLNHIIIFCNVFTVPMGVRLLFSRMTPDMYPVIKTFLVFLNYISESGYIPECSKMVAAIPMDDNLFQLLTRIGDS